MSPATVRGVTAVGHQMWSIELGARKRTERPCEQPAGASQNLVGCSVCSKSSINVI
jgi:hypothetical protein